MYILFLELVIRPNMSNCYHNCEFIFVFSLNEFMIGNLNFLLLLSDLLLHIIAADILFKFLYNKCLFCISLWLFLIF